MGRPELHPILQMHPNQSPIKLHCGCLSLILNAATYESKHTICLIYYSTCVATSTDKDPDPTIYQCCCAIFHLGFDLSKCNTSHLLWLNSICYFSTDFCSRSEYCNISWLPTSQSMIPAVLVSSTHLLTTYVCIQVINKYHKQQWSRHWSRRSQTFSLNIGIPPHPLSSISSHFWIHMTKSL